MTRNGQRHRGYFGIGIETGKNADNLGTLWRTAHNYGASFIFTIGRRYSPQHSDTTKAWRSLPLYNYDTLEHFKAAIPRECQVVGIEYPNDQAKPLTNFNHPSQAIYLLGAEDHGLSKQALALCHRVTMIPGSVLDSSLNVSVAGSILMYDRFAKSQITEIAA